MNSADGGLVDYLHASPMQLVRALGSPGVGSDPEKIHVEWVVHTPHGAASIGDYTDGGHTCSLWCDLDPRRWPADSFVEWHIWAHNTPSAAWLVAPVATLSMHAVEQRLEPWTRRPKLDPQLRRQRGGAVTALFGEVTDTDLARATALLAHYSRRNGDRAFTRAGVNDICSAATCQTFAALDPHLFAPRAPTTGPICPRRSPPGRQSRAGEHDDVVPR